MEVNAMPSATSAQKGAAQPETKQALMIHMLRSKGGATLPALMKATGWQAHSVRGFFSGVIRKKLKLELTSEGDGDKRVYRVSTAPSAATAVKASKRRART
jgi:hypothetical protein